MLIIISDLHLTDGTSGDTIREDAFKIFCERLHDLAYAASCRKIGKDETYEPVDAVYLLLLGDILDVIRSTKWLADKVRPWDNNPQDKAFVRKVREITNEILNHNQKSLDIFRGFKERGITVRKVKDGTAGNNLTETVPVYTYYMVGNHDWFYHLPGTEYDKIRASIIEALGLRNDPADVFPHDPAESPAIQQMCTAHHVFARHGDIYDSANYEKPDRNRSSLGDAIVIELVDRFAHEARNLPKGQVPDPCLVGLREIDNVRPLDLIPAWVDGLLRRTCNPDEAKLVRGVWNRVAKDFLKVPFVKRRHSSLKWGLILSERMSLVALGKIVPWAKRVLTSLGGVLPLFNKFLPRLGLSEDFYPYAFRERAFKDPGISYIAYGHTHRYEVVPLRAGAAEPPIPKLIYINSGTWRAVYELARHLPGNEEFVGYKVMTYVAFFKGDERKGRAFETWSGALES